MIIGGVYDQVPRYYSKFDALFDSDADGYSQTSSCIHNGLKTRAENPNLKKVINVRHPFSRLLSAWRDKFAKSHGGRAEQYAKHFRPILKKLQEPSDEYTEGYFIPFVSFLRVVIYARKTKDKTYYNTHWMPYYESCSTCLMNYDFIIKQESSFTDANFILKATGLSNVTYLLGQYQDSLLLLNGVKSWYEKVPNEIMQDLYKLYFPDFVLFNYTVTDFLH